MSNTQLQSLLDRSTLSHEDQHNIRVIFRALSTERQMHILEHWEVYMARILLAREKLLTERSLEIVNTLRQVNALLDAAIARHTDIKQQKKQQQAQTREELAATLKNTQ